MDFQIWWAFAFVLGLTGIQSITRITIAMLEKKKSAPPLALEQIAEKVERISQAVEATAIEVERIGEAQRFLTRVLSEKTGGQIGSGADKA
jgi:hypothetical protein